jgi:UDP:flavonoid glycosyltransferase YjiC (YdhE family)
MEMIHDLGYEGDYFVSRFWSRATAWDWDRQLALRLGMLFERVRPAVVVFDGTWPYRGLLHATSAYGACRTVWSNLTLYKPDFREVPVSESNFDLIIRLGELGSSFTVNDESTATRKVTVPPITLLRDEELLDWDAARESLGLTRDGRYALFSLGPGNLKDVSQIGRDLIDEVKRRGYEIVWTRTPISASDIVLPDGVIPISVYPLVRYMRAFDVIVSAAGYNTCCEVLQSGVPTLYVPKTLVADDQTARAAMVADIAPAIVSPCETAEQRHQAIDRLLALTAGLRPDMDLGGAERAADEILALIKPG